MSLGSHASAILSSVILGLVPGIQPRDVRRVKRVLRTADAVLLDPRHKGEDDGGK